MVPSIVQGHSNHTTVFCRLLRPYPFTAIVVPIGWIYVAATPDQRQNLGTALVLLLLESVRASCEPK